MGNKITGQRGHHTTVEESVGPAVTQETIKPHRHEEATQAVDREVHQHHYHTTVQPLQHQERLPEKHTHNILPAEEREFHHDNKQDTEQRLTSEMAHFKDHKRVEQTHHTQAAAPTVTGEHVHHHVHETVVPVVQKETIQPEVVHTTIPVHETHHAASQHHGLSALPMKTLDEFKTAGGVLTGGKHGAHEEYDGPPRKYNDKLSTTFEKLGLEAKEAMSGHHSGTTGTGHHTGTTDTTVKQTLVSAVLTTTLRERKLASTVAWTKTELAPLALTVTEPATLALIVTELATLASEAVDDMMLMIRLARKSQACCSG